MYLDNGMVLNGSKYIKNINLMKNFRTKLNFFNDLGRIFPISFHFDPKFVFFFKFRREVRYLIKGIVLFSGSKYIENGMSDL